MPRLSKKELLHQMADLPGWRYQNNALSKRFDVANFAQALAFVNRVGTEAEQAQHHPDILIQYNQVTLTLTTHDEGGVTERDITLAHRVEGIRL